MSSRRWMWGMLAATLAATLWTALSDDDASAPRAASVVQPARAGDARSEARASSDTNGASATASAVVAPESAAAPERPAVNAAAVDVFAAYTWQPPPPPPVPAGPPPKPMPPPLPYVYAGRVVDGGKTQFLLLEQGTLHSLAAGAAVGDYLLESGSDTQLVFLHRPTGERQTLAIAPQASLP